MFEFFFFLSFLHLRRKFSIEGISHNPVDSVNFSASSFLRSLLLPQEFIFLLFRRNIFFLRMRKRFTFTSATYWRRPRSIMKRFTTFYGGTRTFYQMPYWNTTLRTVNTPLLTILCILCRIIWILRSCSFQQIGRGMSL